MTTETKTTTVSDAELEQLAAIYTGLQEPKRSIFVAAGQLLHASQIAGETPTPESTRQSAQKAG